MKSKHTMAVHETFNNNIHRWSCNTCDRDFIMQLVPFKRIIINEGETDAIHAGFTSDELRINNITIKDEETINLDAYENWYKLMFGEE